MQFSSIIMYVSVVATKQMCMCQLCTAVKKWIVFAWNVWQMVRQQKSMMVNLSNTQRKYQMRRKGLNCLGEHRDIVLGKANIGWPVAMTIASKCTDEDLDPHTMIFLTR